MPICGIEIQYLLNDFEAYKKQIPSLNWFTPVDIATGEMAFSQIRTDKRNRYTYKTIIHSANFKNLSLKVKEVQRCPIRKDCNLTIKSDFVLEINGSLHCCALGNNFEPLYFAELVSEICDIESELRINAMHAHIRNIETGVNLTLLDFPPSKVLSNLLICSGKTFNQYEKKNVGYYRELTEFTVKLYDKGYQSQTYTPILRYELHFNRMRKVNRLNIRTLADLKSKGKVIGLLKLIKETFETILMFDNDILLHEHSPQDRKFLEHAQYGKYWQRLHETKSRTYVKKQKDRLKRIINEKGFNYHTAVGKQICDEWEQLFKKEVTVSQGEKHHKGYCSGDEITIKMKGETVNHCTQKCLTCGRDISKQRKGSKFCSEKLFGVQAKSCRNKDSNPRNYKRKKLNRLISRGVLFDIRYFLE